MERSAEIAVPVIMSNKIEGDPSEVAAEEGKVIVDGPDGVAVTFSAEAALETSDRLFEAGMMAVGQDVKRRDAERLRRAGLPPRDS